MRDLVLPVVYYKSARDAEKYSKKNKIQKNVTKSDIHTICIVKGIGKKVKQEKITQEELLRKYHVDRSFLTVHNFGSNFSEFYELNLPYMLLYESRDLKHDSFCVMEFTAGGHYYITATGDELKSLGERSLHKHDFYEMMFVLSGEVKQHIEDITLHFRKGDCCLYNRNVRHLENFETNFEIVLMMFTEPFMEQLIKNDTCYSSKGLPYAQRSIVYDLVRQNMKNQFYTTKEYIDFTRIDEKERDITEYYRIFNQMLQEMTDKKPGSSFFIQGCFSRLFSFLENKELYLVQNHKILSSQEEELFLQISSLLEKHHGRIPRRDIESRLNYSSDYINRIIKKYTDLTLVEYGRIFCLKEAEKLLMSSQLKIGEICAQLGFTNRSYFNRIFYEQYQSLPSDYRKNRK